MTTELKDRNTGVAIIGDKKYEFQYSELSKDQLHVIINNQVRKIEFHSSQDTIYLFDPHGDSIAYKFLSDDLKEN